MAKLTGSIASIESLDEEINRLSAHAKKLEKELGDQFNYVQENYSSMIRKTVLSSVSLGGSLPATLLSPLLQNTKLQDSVGRLADQLVNRLSEGLNFLSAKLAPKED